MYKFIDGFLKFFFLDYIEKICSFLGKKSIVKNSLDRFMLFGLIFFKVES